MERNRGILRDACSIRRDGELPHSECSHTRFVGGVGLSWINGSMPCTGCCALMVSIPVRLWLVTLRTIIPLNASVIR